MPQPGEFLGPFLGINTTLDPSQIGPAFAVKARNVILSDGRIRPRMAWRHLRFTSDRDAIQLGTDQAIASMYHWNRSEATDEPDILVKTRYRHADVPLSGQLWLVARNRVARQLATGLSNQTAQFIKYEGLIYVLDGSQRMWVTDGEPNGTIYAGMEHPTLEEDVWAQVESYGGATLWGSVTYAVTFLNPHGGESNPLYFGGGVYDSAEATPMQIVHGQATAFTIYGKRLAGPGRAARFRIYRRNLTLGQVGWRLIHEGDYPSDAGFVEFFDVTPEEDITVSSDVTGPFAPSRHTLLPRASMGAMYRHRLFFTHAEYAPNVYFSAIGEPQHVDVDDKIPLEGEADDGINGMAAMADQLFVGKERGIQVIAGDIHTATDETNATGAQPLESNHRSYPTNVTTGPTGAIEGNNFVKAGEPSRLMYVAKHGLHDFDGVNERFVGDAIERTWSEFGYRGTSLDDRGVESFEFAHDAAEGILYICAGRSASDPSHPVLAYHYRVNRGDGLGIWTTIDAGGVSPHATPTDESKTITAIAGSLGERSGGTRRSSILVGFRDGTLAIGDADTADLPMPDFEWESGDMIVDRGLRVHVYAAKVFYTVIQGVIGMERSAPMIFEVVLKQGKQLRPRMASADLADETREFVAIPVRREGTRFSLKLAKGPSWATAADLGVGIVGWEMQTEIVGAA
jgi:hypothetical protein